MLYNFTELNVENDMHNIRKNVKEGFNTFSGLLLLAVITIFYFSRPEELVVLLPIIIITTLINILRPSPKINDNKKILILCGVILCYLVYSYFNSRIYSYDGLNYHIKYMLSIANKGYVATTEYPVRPYLGEYIFAFIYKFAGLRMLNLTLGIVSILNVYFAYLILSGITNNRLERNLSLALFVSSPTFIALSSTELKPDTISSLSIFITLLLLIKFLNGKYYLFPIIGIFSGLSILIKSSSFFITPFFIATGGIYLLKSKTLLRTKIFLSIVTVVLFCLPIILWFIFYGGTFPQIENSLNIKPLINSNPQTMELERFDELVKECNEDKLKKDYSSFIFGGRSLFVLFQPFFYITNFSKPIFSAQRMANPGIFVYCGMVILLASVFFYKKLNLNPVAKKIYWLSIFSTIVFMILVSSILWYMLPIFPIYALVISILINKIENKFTKKTLLILIYSTVVMNIIIGIKTAEINFSPIEDFSKEQLYNTELSAIYDMNMDIDNISEGSYILDASEHRFNVLTTFVPNVDERVIKSNYYFASKTKSLEAFREELLRKNIKIIIVKKEYLLNPWYEKCPLQNNLNLMRFLEKYTVPVSNDKNKHENLIFKII